MTTQNETESVNQPKNVDFPPVNFQPVNSQRQFNFVFSDVEAELLIKIIDIATRAAGLEIAKQGVMLVDKILASVKDQSTNQ